MRIYIFYGKLEIKYFMEKYIILFIKRWYQIYTWKLYVNNDLFGYIYRKSNRYILNLEWIFRNHKFYFGFIYSWNNANSSYWIKWFSHLNSIWFFFESMILKILLS